MALVSALDVDLLTLRHVFLCTPSLKVNVSEVEQLFGLRSDHAVAALTLLEAEGWLMRSPNGAYRRSEPAMS
jgi:predicted transcriptional regulator of viral defense system